MKTAYLYDTRFLDHSNGAGHPERPERVDAINDVLRDQKLWDSLTHLKFEAATDAQLELCHSTRQIDQVRTLAAEGGGQVDGDTRVGKDSFTIAKLAAGAGMRAVHAVLKNECDNAFVAARPPGHHAESNRSMGFCLFNSIALAARYAQRELGIERVAILDWDVHHGNGTQEIFYEDPSVLFASVHQWPLYPGTGRREETGKGAGEGSTHNFPLPAGSDDAEYARIWDLVGKEVEQFKPQLILVSAGFDAHARDPLGGMKISASGFAHLARQTKNWAKFHGDARVVCFLEGGYSLRGLSQSVAAVVEVLGE